MSPTNLGRRRFLQTGSVLLSLPWLESLAVRCRAAAAEADGPGLHQFRALRPGVFSGPKPGADYEPSEYLTISTTSATSSRSSPASRIPRSAAITPPKLAFSPAQASDQGRLPQHRFARLRRRQACRRQPRAFRCSRFDARQQPADLHAQRRRRPGAGDAIGDFRPDVPGRQAERRRQEIDRLKRGQSVLDRMGGSISPNCKTAQPLDRQQLADYAEAVRDMERQLAGRRSLGQASEANSRRPSPARVSQPVLGPQRQHRSGPGDVESDPSWPCRPTPPGWSPCSFAAWTKSRRSTA